VPLDALDAAGVRRASKGHHQRGHGLEDGNGPFSLHGKIHSIFVVVLQVIDNVGVVGRALAGVILVADIVVEARAEEKRPDPGHASGEVLASLSEDVVGDSGLGKDGHDENDKKDRKTCVEIQDADGGKLTSFYAWLSCHGE
jgi:hypothetical protein